VLFAPIGCKNCKQQFCPQHRFPGDHNCASTATVTISKPPSQQKAELSTKASAAGSAALEAVRRKWAATPSAPSPSRVNLSGTKPFSQTDRSPPLVSPSTSHANVSITVPTSNPSSPTTNTTTSTTYNPTPAIDFMSFVPRPIFASA
jgi:hypothetical protein